MKIISFDWIKVPTGKIGSLGKEIEDYVLKNPDNEKYCEYESKYIFIQAPKKSNGIYKIIEGHVYYDHYTFSLSVTGRYIKNNGYASSWSHDIIPCSSDRISKEYLNIPFGESTYAKLAIFDSLEEAQEACKVLNKKLKEKREQEAKQKDIEEYKRLKEKLGL